MHPTSPGFFLPASHANPRPAAAVNPRMALSRRKLRRTGKWTGLVMVALVMCVDAASVWLRARIADPAGHVVMIGSGEVDFLWGFSTRSHADRWLSGVERVNHEPLTWWFGMARIGPTGAAWIPIWSIAAAAALLAAGLCFLARPIPGQCAGCGYNLRGLAKGAVCPECGNAIADRAKE